MRKRQPPRSGSCRRKKLRRLLAYAYERSDYYRESFSAAGLTAGDVETAPLSAFPTIDKATLLEHFDRITTVSDVTQEELRVFRPNIIIGYPSAI